MVIVAIVCVIGSTQVGGHCDAPLLYHPLCSSTSQSWIDTLKKKKVPWNIYTIDLNNPFSPQGMWRLLLLLHLFTMQVRDTSTWDLPNCLFDVFKYLNNEDVLYSDLQSEAHPGGLVSVMWGYDHS